METTNLAHGGQESAPSRIFAAGIGLIIVFSAVARGAHDIWAATAVYLAILLLSVFFLIQSARGRVDKIRFPLLVPLLIFLTVAAFSFARSSNPSESFLALMDVIAAALMFILSANVFRWQTVSSFFLGLTVPCLWFESALVVASVVATRHQQTAQVFLAAHPALAYFLPVPEIFYTEKMGSLINANLLSVFLLPLFVLLGAKLIAEWLEKKAIPSFWASGFLAALIGLALSKSGSAWMSLLLALLCLEMWFAGAELVRRHKKMVFAAVALVFAMLAALLIYKFTHTIDPSVDPHRNNFNRLYWWDSAWHMFLDHPWSGVGIGNYGSAYLSYKIGGTENTLYAHGWPLTVLSEMGLTGALSCAVLLIAFARALRSLIPSHLRAHPHLTALTAVFLFYTINIGLEYLVNLLLFAILAGMTLANAPAVAVKPRLSSVIIAAALALGAVAFVVSPFFASRSSVAARAALESGDLVQAEKGFQDAIELDPRAWEPYVGLARIANKQGDTASAVAWQQKALERNKLNRPLQRELESYQRASR